MARHSITVVHRTTGSSSNTERQDKPTSARRNISSSGVSRRNVQSTRTQRTYLENKVGQLAGAAKAMISVKAIEASINVYTTVASAATGDQIKYNKLKVGAGALMNPLGFIAQVAPQQILGELRVQRQNRELEYQRQLTGNIAFSRKTSTGTF